MKLFGKKDTGHNEQGLEGEELPEGAGPDDAFEESGEPLSAPTRPQASGGGSRKNLLLLLAVLVVGGLGAGYYYMTMDTAYVAPDMSAAPEPDPLASAPPPADIAAAPADAAAVPPMLPPAITPTETAIAPAPPADPLALPPADDLLDDDILAAAPPMPGEVASSEVAVVATPDPVADPLAIPEPGTPEAAAAPAPEPDQLAADPLASPPPVETAAVPVEAPVSDPVEMPPESPEAVAVETGTGTAAQPGQNAVAATDEPLSEAPEEAISLPADAVPSVTPADPVAVVAAPEEATPPADATASAVTPADPAAVAAAQEEAARAATPPAPAASQGELAIVNNAGTLDKITPPAATDQANDLLDSVAEQAMIRPLPRQYLVVQKDHAGGELDSRLSAARMALAQGRSQASLQIFNELYEDHPRDKRVLMGRAVALQKLGQVEAALGAYEEVLNRDPKNLDALTNMLGLLKNENPSLAVEKLLELREAYPYNAEITTQLAVAYGGAGEYEEALKYLDMADALKPGSAFVLYNRGVLYDKMGRTAEAAGIYRQIVRLAADGHLDRNLPVDSIRRRLAVMR